MSAEPDRIRHIVLGIGMDVNMDLRDLPADIRRCQHDAWRRKQAGASTGPALLQQLLRELDRWYAVFLRKTMPQCWRNGQSLNNARSETGCP